ncbi:hypothetical protein ISCGN_026472 [Ixodes scapularis]
MQLTLLLFTQVLTSLRATAPLGAVTKGDAFLYVPEPSTTVITGLHVPPGIAEEDLPVITDCDGSFDKSIVVLDLPIFFEQGTPRVFVDGYIGARHFDCVGFGAGTLGDMQLTLLLFTQVLTSLRATAPLGAVTKGDAFLYVPEPSTTVITGLHVPPGIAEEDLPVITDCDGSFDKSIVVLDLPIFFEQGTPRVFVDGYIGARHFDCVGFGAGTLGDMQLTLLLFTQVLTSLRATAPLGAVTKGDAFLYVPEPSTTVITGLHVPPGIAEEDLPVITDCDGSFDKSIVVLDLPIFFEQGTPRVFVDGYIGARHFDCVGFGAGTLGDMQLTLLLFTQVLTSLRATAPLGAVTKGDAFLYVPEPSTTVITGLHVPPGIAEEDLPVITDCDGSFDKSIVVLDLPIFFEQGTPRVFVDGYIGARHFDCVGFGAGTLGDMQLTLLLFTQVLTSLRATAPLGAVTKGDAFLYVPEPSTTVITGLHVPPGIAEEDLPVITDCDGSFDKSIVVLDLPIFFEQGTPRVFVDGYIGARHFDCVGFGAGTLGDMQLTLLLFTQCARAVLRCVGPRATSPLPQHVKLSSFVGLKTSDTTIMSKESSPQWVGVNLRQPDAFDFSNVGTWPTWRDRYDDYVTVSGLGQAPQDVQDTTIMSKESSPQWVGVNLGQPDAFDFSNVGTWPTWRDRYDDYVTVSGLGQAPQDVQVRALHDGSSITMPSLSTDTLKQMIQKIVRDELSHFLRPAASHQTIESDDSGLRRIIQQEIASVVTPKETSPKVTDGLRTSDETFCSGVPQLIPDLPALASISPAFNRGPLPPWSSRPTYPNYGSWGY